MTKEEEVEITKLEEQIDGLSKQVTDMTAILSDPVALKTALKKAKGDKKDDPADGEPDEDDMGKLVKERDELKKAIADLTLVAAMSDIEKAFYAKLDDAGKATFKALSAEDRTKEMKKSETSDEVIKVDGTEIKKSVVGASQFAVIKSQQARIEKQDADIAKERDLREVAELSKRADTEFPHVPGSVEERAGMLKALGKMEEPLRKSFEAVFTQSEKLSKMTFEKLGRKGVPEDDLLAGKKKNGISKFEQHVDEIHKTTKGMTRTEAMAKARTDYPDDYAAYQQADAN